MRDMRLLIRRLAEQGMTVLLSSHLLTEVEDVCNRVAIVRQGRIVYEGEIAALKRGAGTRYWLQTTDDERALAVCRAQPGIADVQTEHGRISFTADEDAAGALSQALVESGALIRAMAPQTVTLEDLFFSFTEGDGVPPTPPTSQVPASAGPSRPGQRDRALMPGVGTVYRWELFKLRHQKRTYLGLGAAIIVPILFVLAIHLRHHHDRGGGFAFSDYLDRSGLAVPLVILLFGAVWMFPLITALVAGDIFASEDHNGTLKTIFTRSLERWQLFAGKALAASTYAVIAIFLCGTVAVIAGSLQSGFNSLQSLSGTIVSAPKALELVYVSLLVYLIPIAAIVCIGLLLSSVTRNSAAAVVGTLMVSLLIQLIGILPGLGGFSPTCSAPSSTPGRGCCARPPTGSRSCGRYGCARSTGSPRSARRSWSSSAATSPVADPPPDAERVLVVDDDPPLQRMLTRTLSAEGFDVTVAGDGGAALAAAERFAPDVIVLDVAMPTLDGLAVCRRLRGKGLPTPDPDAHRA